MDASYADLLVKIGVAGGYADVGCSQDLRRPRNRLSACDLGGVRSVAHSIKTRANRVYLGEPSEVGLARRR